MVEIGSGNQGGVNYGNFEAGGDKTVGQGPQTGGPITVKQTEAALATLLTSSPWVTDSMTQAQQGTTTDFYSSDSGNPVLGAPKDGDGGSGSVTNSGVQPFVRQSGSQGGDNTGSGGGSENGSTTGSGGTGTITIAAPPTRTDTVVVPAPKTTTDATITGGPGTNAATQVQQQANGMELQAFMTNLQNVTPPLTKSQIAQLVFALYNPWRPLHFQLVCRGFLRLPSAQHNRV